MFMKFSKVGAAVTAKELYITENLGIIAILRETAVVVLNKTAGENHSVGHFIKLLVISALRANKALGPRALDVG